MDSLEFFATQPVFTHAEYAHSRSGHGRSSRTVDSLLRRHLSQARIVRVRRGLYASVPRGVEPKTLAVDPYLLATKVAEDATVSHHAALQFHGRTYSIWNQTTFFTLSHIRPFDFGTSRFVPVRPASVFAGLPSFGGGVELVSHAGGEVRVTSCERALVDLLHSPELGGGWEEVWRSLEMVEFFDLEAVIDYTLALETALTAARVGFFLEQHRDELFVEDRHLNSLEARRPGQNRYLDTSRESGQLVTRWRLIVPERVLHRRWEEVS